MKCLFNQHFSLYFTLLSAKYVTFKNLVNNGFSSSTQNQTSANQLVNQPVFLREYPEYTKKTFKLTVIM